MFDRLTERARNVHSRARDEAGRLGHDFVGTEHVLLVLHDAGGGAAAVLGELGVDRARMRAAVERVATRGDSRSDSQLPFTPEFKEMLEHAVRIAKSTKAPIGTKDLFLGLLVAARAISTTGRALSAVGLTDIDAVQGAVERLGARGSDDSFVATRPAP